MWRVTRWALAAIAATATVFLLTGFARADTTSDGSSAVSENAFVAKINAERRDRGLTPLKVDLQLTRVARGWAAEMSSRDRMFHNPDLADQVRGDWIRLGENVGYSSKSGAREAELVDRLHRAFMASPSHKANILGRFNRVGVGVRIARDGTMWVTANFAKSSGLSNARVNRAAHRAERAFVTPSSADSGADFAIVASSTVSDGALEDLFSPGGPTLLTHRGTSVDPNPVLHPVSREQIDRAVRDGGLVYLAGSEISDRTARELTAGGYRVRRVSLSTAAVLR